MVNMNNTFVSRLRKVAGIEVKEPLDLGLSRINARLGMHGTHGGTDPRKPAKIRVEHTEARARSIFFAPDMTAKLTPAKSCGCGHQLKAPARHRRSAPFY